MPVPSASHLTTACPKIHYNSLLYFCPFLCLKSYCFSTYFLIKILYGYHLKCNPITIMYCGTKMKSGTGPLPCNRYSEPLLWNFCAKVAQVLIFCIHEGNIFSVPNITFHQSNFCMSVTHLAVCILTRKYQIRQYYTHW
jgi:hypothetical protein